MYAANVCDQRESVHIKDTACVHVTMQGYKAFIIRGSCVA